MGGIELPILSKIADVKVISRTSVMRYRDTELGLGQVAERLGVVRVQQAGGARPIGGASV